MLSGEPSIGPPSHFHRGRRSGAGRQGLHLGLERKRWFLDGRPRLGSVAKEPWERDQQSG